MLDGPYRNHNMLSSTIVEPSTKPTASIIWLHGLGADSNDFADLPSTLHLTQPVRFIFPNAPIRPISIYDGYELRAWYDVLRMDFLAGEDERGIRESSALIHELIHREQEQKIFSKRIILAGFSQGGAITLYAGLRYPEALGGLLVLSSYLPLANSLFKEAADKNRYTPICVLHGSLDNIIPIEKAEKSRDQLIDNHYEVQWKSYPMKHTLCADEIVDIKNWLEKILGQND